MMKVVPWEADIWRRGVARLHVASSTSRCEGNEAEGRGTEKASWRAEWGGGAIAFEQEPERSQLGPCEPGGKCILGEGVANETLRLSQEASQRVLGPECIVGHWGRG